MRNFTSKSTKYPLQDDLSSLEIQGKSLSSKNALNDKNEFTFNYQNCPQPQNKSRETLSYQNRDDDGPLTKAEIFQHLNIKNTQIEQVSDLGIYHTEGSSVRTKQEVRDNVIENLEKEIEKLKYKRDNYLAVI